MTPAPRRNLLFSLALLPALWLAAGALVSHRLVTRPEPRLARLDPPGGLARAPGFEEVALRTADGETVLAWLADPAVGEDPVTVLFLHGNGGSRRSHGPLLHEALARGLGLCVLGLRAHEASSGRTNDFGWSAREDVLAAVEHLERTRPGQRIALFGTSLGAAAAIYAADRLEGRVDAFVLEAPYRSVEDAARDRCALVLPPLVDRLAFLALRVTFPAFVEVGVEALRPVERMESFSAPQRVLLLGATDDPRVPVEDLHELARRCVHAEVELRTFATASHAALAREFPVELADAIVHALR